MEKLVKNFFKSSITTAIVLFLLGLLLIIKPAPTIIGISYLLGGILTVLGITAFIRFSKGFGRPDKSDIDVAYGIISLILGFLVITHPVAIASIIPIVLGLCMVIHSAIRLQYSFGQKMIGSNKWKNTMIYSIIGTIFGIILLFNPFPSAVAITMVIGISLVLYAIIDVLASIALMNDIKTIYKAVTEEKVKEADVIEEKIKSSKKKRKKLTTDDGSDKE